MATIINIIIFIGLVLVVFYSLGIALFIAGIALWSETGSAVWLILSAVGVLIATKSDV